MAKHPSWACFQLLLQRAWKTAKSSSSEESYVSGVLQQSAPAMRLPLIIFRSTVVQKLLHQLAFYLLVFNLH